MSGTRNAFLAASGSLLSSSSRVSVVIMVIFLGGTRVWFFLYGGYFVRCVASHEKDRCHRIQKGRVFVYIWGVDTARGFFIATNVCGLTNIYNIIFYFFFPCWFAPSFSVGRVSKSHVCPDIYHGVVAGCPLLVLGVVPGLGEILTVVALPQILSAYEAIRVWITPRWPFFVVFSRLGVVAELIVGLVPAALC